MRAVFFLFWVALLFSANLSRGSDIMSPGELIALADVMAARPSIVALGDVEEAPAFIKPDERELAYVCSGFGLKKIRVRKVIRAAVPMSEMIYVQYPERRPSFIKGWRASLGNDGRTKLIFLVPGTQLHEYTNYLPVGDKVRETAIREAAKLADPQAAFEKLGVASTLNAKSWFEVWNGRGAFTTRTDLPPQVRPPVTPSPPGQFSYWRARQADERYVPYMLPKEFLDDLEVLLDSHAVVEAGEEPGINGIRSKLRSAEAREVLDQWVKDARKRSTRVP